jgi:hypothetical protein
LTGSTVSFVTVEATDSGRVSARVSNRSGDGSDPVKCIVLFCITHKMDHNNNKNNGELVDFGLINILYVNTDN